jgi:hypothetical protein
MEPFAVTSRPTRVANLPKITALASGDDFFVALAGQTAIAHDLDLQHNAVWSWGAGHPVPQPVPDVDSTLNIRAAGETAMARSEDARYWLWTGAQMRGVLSTRQAFDALGRTEHAIVRPTQLASTTKPDSETRKPPMELQTSLGTPSASVATRTPGTMTVPTEVAPELKPHSKDLTPPESTVVAPQAVAVVPPTHEAVHVKIRGTARLNNLPLEGVQVTAVGANCSATDNEGHYFCQANAGWSGRVSVRKANYQFSPSAMSFQNLRGDIDQQDFSAIYDPR